jgi:DNA-directed RNA polymerase
MNKKEKEKYFGHFIFYTGRRSCFAKHFSKIDSDSTENLLQHSHNAKLARPQPQLCRTDFRFGTTNRLPSQFPS